MPDDYNEKVSRNSDAQNVQIQGLRIQCPHFMAKKTKAEELNDLFLVLTRTSGRNTTRTQCTNIQSSGCFTVQNWLPGMT